MGLKKIVVLVAAILALFLLSFPIAPIGPSCEKGKPSACGFISNVVLVTGSLVFLKSEVESKIIPGLSVQVELDDGTVKPGSLTMKAIGGRPIKSGEKVRLNCTKAYASVEKPDHKMCELEFLGFDPTSACPKGTPCYGKIPSWSISVDPQGIPDAGLLSYK
ncbi:MAG: hypothetical protein JSU04_07600 [Bdellovibrionales bacterium]|nr:hypothetical protein [Bdellovibrionales bacterium]